MKRCGRRGTEILRCRLSAERLEETQTVLPAGVTLMTVSVRARAEGFHTVDAGEKPAMMVLIMRS